MEGAEAFSEACLGEGGEMSQVLWRKSGRETKKRRVFYGTASRGGFDRTFILEKEYISTYLLLCHSSPNIGCDLLGMESTLLRRPNLPPPPPLTLSAIGVHHVQSCDLMYKFSLPENFLPTDNERSEYHFRLCYIYSKPLPSASRCPHKKPPTSGFSLLKIV